MSLKILLADDSLTAQNMGKKILADAGYEVIAVSNGAQAMKKIAADSPDLVVLDVYMPGYSGVEICERIRGSRETASIPVVLSVGKMEAFKPEEGTRVRADGLIVKPFEATELLAVVKKLANSAPPLKKRPVARPEADRAPVSDNAAADFSDDLPEFEVQHQSIEVPKEVASAPAIGMDLISEDLRQSPAVEFELERSPEPVQTDHSTHMAAADGLSGVFELGSSNTAASESPVPELSSAEAEEPRASAEDSSDGDRAAATEDLTIGAGAYEHEAALDAEVEEAATPVMDAVSGSEPQLLDHNNNAAMVETDASPEPAVLPELTSWNEPVAPPMLEMPDLSAVPAMETSAAGVVTPRWVAEEVEVAPEDRAISLHEEMQRHGETAEPPVRDVLESVAAQDSLPSHATSSIEPLPEADSNTAIASEPQATGPAPTIREAALDSGRITSIVEQLLERLKPEVIAAVTRELEKKQ